MILMLLVKRSQSYRNSKLAMSLQYLKKEVRNEVDFLHADKHQSFLQLDFSTLGFQVSQKVILSLLLVKNSQSTQSNKFSISLQYLKKMFKNGVHFLHVDQNQSFHKLTLSFLVEVVRHVQSTQNRKLAMLLQYIKKNLLQLLLCSIVMQNVTYYMGPVISIVTYYLQYFYLQIFLSKCNKFLHFHMISF